KTRFDPQNRLWVGVELERPIGKHDGTVKGQFYFESKPKHGTFVAPAQCEPYTEEKAAARKIQATARMRMARKKVKEEVHWRAFNMIDNQDEHMSRQRHQRIFAAGLGATARLSRAVKARLLSEAERLPEVPSAPTLTMPRPTRAELVALISYFRGGGVLPYKQVIRLLNHYERLAAELPTMQLTTVGDGERLTIVGDTHGQLQDLYSIFTINGLPSSTNRYLINGDFVDRGPNGVEVVLTLFAMQLHDPSSIILNRGNHEERSQNETGGFMTEVLSKYKDAGPGSAGAHDAEGWASVAAGSSPTASDAARAGTYTAAERGAGRAVGVYESFHSCFDALPLCTLIEKHGLRVFVVHGGLFDREHNVKLDHIAAVTRKREIPWGRESLEDTLFEDMVWSDPRDDIRGTEPSSRGAGVFFGEDITERFCAQNGVSLVVRSHECVKEGYRYQHKQRCLTIFSASKYCGTSTNSGAFIVFDPDLTNVVQQFVAGDLKSTDPQYHSDDAAAAPLEAVPAPSADASKEEVERQARANRDKIIERIVLKKPDLFWYFTHQDTEGKGRVSRKELAEGLATVLKMPDLPWTTLSYDLVESEPDGSINYTLFLERYRIAMREEDSGWQDAIIQRVCRRLFSVCSDLKGAYRIFDVNEDGRIEYAEFVQAMEKLDVGLTRPQLYELMRSIDRDKDAHIDFDEFAARFKVVFTRFKADGAQARSLSKAIGSPHSSPRGGASDASAGTSDESEFVPDDWTRDALTRVGQHLFAGGRNVAQVFTSIDKDGDKTVSLDEFVSALDSLKLDPPFSRDDAKRLLDVIDTTGSGRINYVEFLDAFKVVDSATLPTDVDDAEESLWQRRVIEKVVSVLYEYRIELRAAFEKFDLDGSGTVSKDEFRLGLRALTAALGSPMSDMQADELLEALDKNGDGLLSYQEFLDGFQIVDVGDGSPESSPRGDSPSGAAAAAASSGAARR
ncbi:pef-1, partial [Symbiodinium sp. KB8]